MTDSIILPPDFDLNGEPEPVSNPLLPMSAESPSILQKNSSVKSRSYSYTDPVSWYNFNKCDHAKDLLRKEGWQLLSVDAENIETWKAPFDESASATFSNAGLYNFSNKAFPFAINTSFTAFQILVLLEFKGNYHAAIGWICINFLCESIPFLRVGVDYFKMISTRDRFNIIGTELKKWKKEEIKEDHGKNYLVNIPRFDNFCIFPDNFNYKAVIDNSYNLYHPFRHKEEPGDITWSQILMEHIFGEQVNLGYRYLQCLYLHPDKMLPILVLVSKERHTGKTTFLNWLNMIFGDNCVLINPSDLSSDFNSSYATSNIIEIEETMIEKNITIEKLKALATGKFVSVNEKFISQYKLPFFGKIILTSNNEDKFAKVDEEEIRFFVRKVGKPKFTNHSIENNLRDEIPAFLSYLSSLHPVDFSVGRVPFTPEELQNDSLKAVKKESKSSLYKELVEHFVDLFENDASNEDFVFANPLDIKHKWYENNNQIGSAYIRSVIKNEFNLMPCNNQRYHPFASPGSMSKAGTPYKFSRTLFFEQAELSLDA